MTDDASTESGGATRSSTQASVMIRPTVASDTVRQIGFESFGHVRRRDVR